MDYLSKRKKAYREWKDKVILPIKIVFIAISPPYNQEEYFYFTDKEIDRRRLSGILFDELGIKNLNKEDALKDFIKNFFLIDAIENPEFNDKKRLRNKRKQIEKNLKRIDDEIRKLNPQIIIVIGKGVYNILNKSLDKSLAKRLEPVNFPTYVFSCFAD